MIFKHINNFKFCLILLILLSSCSNLSNKKFNQKEWILEDNYFSKNNNRQRMLFDLTSNYKLIGLKYDDLTKLLGSPNFTKNKVLTYTVISYHGLDIDPVYTKGLEFKLSEDSIVSSFEVIEWRKGEEDYY